MGTINIPADDALTMEEAEQNVLAATKKPSGLTEEKKITLKEMLAQRNELISMKN